MILNLNVRHNLIFNSFFIVWLMAFLNFIFIFECCCCCVFLNDLLNFKNMCLYLAIKWLHFRNDISFYFINKTKWLPSIYIYVCILCFTNGNLKNVNKTADIIYTKINRLYDGSIRVVWILDISNHYHFSKFIGT